MSDSKPAIKPNLARQNLANKYRPKVFSDLLGQDSAVKILTKALELDRIAPAYLFSGPRGVGKTSAARIFARAASCLEKKSRPCDKCDACASILNGKSMDLIEIDGASHTGVDEVRSIIESIAFRPNLSARTVYIVDEVHMLSNAAFNALLKTLEEPPAHCLFIFATTEQEKVPDTILSRVQRIELRRIPEDVLKTNLREICRVEKIKASETVLSQVVSAADGAFRDAQTLLEQLLLLSGGFDLSDELADQMLGTIGSDRELQFLQALAKRNADTCLGQIQNFFEQGKDLSKLLSRLIRWTRVLLLSRHVRSFESLQLEADSSQLEVLSQAFEAWNPEELDRLFEILWLGHERMKRSDMPRITLETTILRATRIPATEDLRRLIELLQLQPASTSPPVAAPAPHPSASPAAYTPVASAPSTVQRPTPAPVAAEPTKIAETAPEILAALKKLKPSLFGLVASAKEHEWTKETFLMKFSPGHFAFKQLNEKILNQELIKALKEITRKEAKIQVMELDRSSEDELAVSQRNDFLLEAKKKILEDSKVKKATEILKGKVTGVTIEGVKT